MATNFSTSNVKQTVVERFFEGIHSVSEQWAQAYDYRRNDIADLRLSPISGVSEIGQWDPNSDLPVQELEALTPQSVAYTSYGVQVRVNKYDAKDVPESTTVLPQRIGTAVASTYSKRAATVLNNAFSTSAPVGDGAALCSSAHPSLSGNQRNQLSVAADLNETSLEQMLIDIAGLTDERGLKIAVRGTKLIIPKELQFIAERVLNSNLRPATADNDANAMKNMGMIPEGAVVNHFLTDTDAFFIKTDAPNGFKYFERTPLQTSMEGDFDTGNVRFKARERYSFGVSDPRCVFGSPGAA